MIGYLVSEPSTDEGTFGRLTIQGRSWETVELPWRDNKPKVSCIPEGTYHMRAWLSPHFGRKVYQVLDVPGRASVEMHPANWGGNIDNGWYSDLLGCMAPGKGRAVLVAPNGASQRAVLSSGLALNEIFELVGDEWDLEIRRGT